MTIEMHPFTCGTYVIDRGGLDNTSWGELYEHPIPMFAIRHPKGVVVFDTGHNHRGLADPQGWYSHSIDGFKEIRISEDDCLPAQLRRVGIDPAEVTHVVMSHLHVDHAGEMMSFPDAAFIVRASELRYAWWPALNQRYTYVVNDLLPTRFYNYIELPDGIDFDLFGDGTLKLIHTPGHTPGHQSLIMTLPGYDAPMLACADCCYGRKNLEYAICGSGVMWDVQQWYYSIQKLRYWESMGCELWFGHDMEDWNEKMKKYKR